MEKSKENEELLKDKIFSVYFDSLSQPLRQQVYLGQLSGLIYNWYKDYFIIKDKININDMGLEIVKITINLLKNKKENIKNTDNLIGYLARIFENKTFEYYRKYDKFGSRERKDVIRMKESHLGRKLTEDEKTSIINKWYDYEISMEIIGTSLTGSKNDESPHSEYLNSVNSAIISEAINCVLAKKQERSRNCYKALLTLHCIDNVDLYPVLDNQIIEKCRLNSEKLKQYEIYQLYHPDASKDSSEAMASKNLKGLLADLKAYLKEKNPEFFD